MVSPLVHFILIANFSIAHAYISLIKHVWIYKQENRLFPPSLRN